MSQQTFVNYRGYLWFWISAAGLIGLIVWYLIDHPVGGRSGASVFGYSSGAIATSIIIYLMWFGIRKRSYYAYRVSLLGWLAAHVWLGVALLVLVPLHAAFDFGCNVHTLAYVVLCLVVVSGIVGAFFYRLLPIETLSNRGGGALRKRFEQYEAIADEIKKLGSGRSAELSELVSSLDTKFVPTLRSALFGGRVGDLDQPKASAKLSGIPEVDRNNAMKAIALMGDKREMAESIRKEIVVKTKLKIWLYAHIPLSLGLVILVSVHIFSVFFFR